MRADCWLLRAIAIWQAGTWCNMIVPELFPGLWQLVKPFGMESYACTCAIAESDGSNGRAFYRDTRWQVEC